MEIIINIANQFTDAPGGRFKDDGMFSGEEFRKKFLEKNFDSATSITIDLDGTYGYPTSFLEEAFGGLTRQFGYKKVRDKLVFISNDEPGLIDEIMEYIKDE